jgi:hypothetical protein
VTGWSARITSFASSIGLISSLKCAADRAIDRSDFSVAGDKDPVAPGGVCSGGAPDEATVTQVSTIAADSNHAVARDDAVARSNPKAILAVPVMWL